MPYRVNAIFAAWPPPPSLRSARRRASLTQAQLGERAGLSQAEVARLERAGSNPTAATLERLLRATGHRLELRRLDAVDETQLREQLDADAGRAPRRVRGLSAQTSSTDDRGRAPCRRRRALSSIPPACSARSVDARRGLRRHRRRGGRPARIRLATRSTSTSASRAIRTTSKLSASALVGLHAGCAGCAERVPFVPDAAALRRIEVLTLDDRRRATWTCCVRPRARRATTCCAGTPTATTSEVSRCASPSVEDLIAMKRAAGRPRTSATSRSSKRSCACASDDQGRSSARRAASRRSRASAASAATTSAAGASRASSWACPAHRLIMSASPAARPAARRGAVTWWISG